MTTARLMLAGGTGRLVRRPSVVLFDPTGQNLDLASRFDGAASDSDAVDELKKYLIESGFTAAPLVVAQWARGEFDLLVFGDVQVHTSAIAAPMVSGSGSSTWVERHLGAIELGAVTTVEIWSGTAADPTTNLGLGVVACAGFRMSLDFADLGDAAASAAPSDELEGHTIRTTPAAVEAALDGHTIRAAPAAAASDATFGDVTSSDLTVAQVAHVAPQVVASVEPSLAASAEAPPAIAQTSDGVDTEDADEADPVEPEPGVAAAAAVEEVIDERTNQAMTGSSPIDATDPFTASTTVGSSTTASAVTSSPVASSPITAAAVPAGPFDTDGQQIAAAAPRAGLIEASHCSSGHPNPPRGANCYVCGESLLEDQSLGLIEQPTVGRIVFAGGQTVELERAVIMGRKPDGAAAGAHPVFIDHVEVSRSHALVSIEGWTVLVTDQGSRNGTWVVPANDPTPVQIDPQVPHVLEHGTTVHLGAPEVAFVYHFDA